MIPDMPDHNTEDPMHYSEGVSNGRLSLHRFVQVISTKPVKLFGIFPQKGTIAVGSDADIVIFDSKLDVTIQHKDMHSKADYEPHEGFKETEWPTQGLSRGEILPENGKELGEW